MQVDSVDDTKVKKILPKLYARLYSLEAHHSVTPKFSFALKDLAEYLGVFEISEEEMGNRKVNLSDETGSNNSYLLKSTNRLDVIEEN